MQSDDLHIEFISEGLFATPLKFDSFKNKKCMFLEVCKFLHLRVCCGNFFLQCIPSMVCEIYECCQFCFLEFTELWTALPVVNVI